MVFCFIVVFVRVALVLVFLHSNRTVTKTNIVLVSFCQLDTTWDQWKEGTSVEELSGSDWSLRHCLDWVTDV